MYIGPGTLIENRYLIKREIGQGASVSSILLIMSL